MLLTVPVSAASVLGVVTWAVWPTVTMSILRQRDAGGDRVAVRAEDRDDRGGRRGRDRVARAPARPPRPCRRSGWSGSRTGAGSAPARRWPRPGRSRPGRRRSSPRRPRESLRSRRVGRTGCWLTGCSSTGCDGGRGAGSTWSGWSGSTVDGLDDDVRDRLLQRLHGLVQRGGERHERLLLRVRRRLGVEGTRQRGLAVGEGLLDRGRVRLLGRVGSVGPRWRPGRWRSVGEGSVVGSWPSAPGRRVSTSSPTTARNAAHEACDAVTLAAAGRQRVGGHLVLVEQRLLRLPDLGRRRLDRGVRGVAAGSSAAGASVPRRTPPGGRRRGRRRRGDGAVEAPAVDDERRRRVELDAVCESRSS